MRHSERYDHRCMCLCYEKSLLQPVNKNQQVTRAMGETATDQKLAPFTHHMDEYTQENISANLQCLAPASRDKLLIH